MNETTVTLVGNVATNVEYRETVSGGVARFRFAVTARRWDRERATWTDGATSFYTVSAWRSLGANLAASVSVGEPLVVHGRLKVREEELDGRRKTFVDVDAVAVGHDLTRGTAAFRRASRTPVTTTPLPEGLIPDSSGMSAAGAAASAAAPGERSAAGPGGAPTSASDPWATPPPTAPPTVPSTEPEATDYPLVAIP
ncbi:single-stranded DNA-binding protein [Streptomyces sp. NPDC014779]|uniref:single-stranded DNA-binding protein n=1 Tax=Streptomyces sp. NPDC014779 TaxID=3364911 RepID=UPI0036F738C4